MHSPWMQLEIIIVVILFVKLCDKYHQSEPYEQQIPVIFLLRYTSCGSALYSINVIVQC